MLTDIYLILLTKVSVGNDNSRFLLYGGKDKSDFEPFFTQAVVKSSRFHGPLL